MKHQPSNKAYLYYPYDFVKDDLFTEDIPMTKNIFHYLYRQRKAQCTDREEFQLRLIEYEWTCQGHCTIELVWISFIPYYSVSHCCFWDFCDLNQLKLSQYIQGPLLYRTSLEILFCLSIYNLVASELSEYLVFWTRNFTLFAQYWLVPGTDLCVIYVSSIARFTIKINVNQHKPS